MTSLGEYVPAATFGVSGQYSRQTEGPARGVRTYEDLTRRQYYGAAVPQQFTG